MAATFSASGKTPGARSLVEARALVDALGDAFAKAFAVYTVEMMRLLDERRMDTGHSPEVDEPQPGDASPLSPGQPTLDLASAPEWIREAHKRAKGVAKPIHTDPADRRARLIRDRLAIALRRREMTQSALAKRLGKSPSQISRIFKNPERSQLNTLAEIADALEIDLSDIIRDLGPERER